jgi:Flp pilus assembly protein TadG
VEFGIVAPLLLLLLFGVIEFGYGFLQFLDVRHGARETGRLAAVNFQPSTATGVAQANEIIDEGCTRIDTESGVTVELSHPGGGAIGQTATVAVTRDYASLTGFFDFLSIDMDSSVEVRLEQPATWSASTRACP